MIAVIGLKVLRKVSSSAITWWWRDDTARLFFSGVVTENRIQQWFKTHVRVSEIQAMSRYIAPIMVYSNYPELNMICFFFVCCIFSVVFKHKLICCPFVRFFKIIRQLKAIETWKWLGRLQKYSTSHCSKFIGSSINNARRFSSLSSSEKSPNGRQVFGFVGPLVATTRHEPFENGWICTWEWSVTGVMRVSLRSAINEGPWCVC